MTWKNAFDVGACTVEVWRGTTRDYTGILGKGESANVTDAFWSGLSVEVSSSGVVALLFSSGSVEDIFEVRVLPSFALADMNGFRLSLPLSGSGSGQASANDSNTIAFTSGDALTDLSAESPANWLSAKTGGIASNPLLLFSPEVDVPVSDVPTVNCDCSDTSGNRTLLQLRQDLMVRLGFGAQKTNPPPGMADLLNSFLIEAQELLYRRYAALRTERFYSWPLTANVSLYDFNANAETCAKHLDPRKVTWVGVVEGEVWRPLVCGIPPEAYSFNQGGRPLRYEIRQCIEVWPTPTATEHYLVIKGHFGLEAFAADTDTTTIDDRLVFLLALDNAKAHYGKPDAGRALQQMEVLLQNLVAGSHQTRRYLPGKPDRESLVYVQPVPTVPFA